MTTKDEDECVRESRIGNTACQRRASALVCGARVDGDCRSGDSAETAGFRLRAVGELRTSGRRWRSALAVGAGGRELVRDGARLRRALRSNCLERLKLSEFVDSVVHCASSLRSDGPVRPAKFCSRAQRRRPPCCAACGDRSGAASAQSVRMALGARRVRWALGGLGSTRVSSCCEKGRHDSGALGPQPSGNGSAVLWFPCAHRRCRR